MTYRQIVLRQCCICRRIVGRPMIWRQTTSSGLRRRFGWSHTICDACDARDMRGERALEPSERRWANFAKVLAWVSFAGFLYFAALPWVALVWGL